MPPSFSTRSGHICEQLKLEGNAYATDSNHAHAQQKYMQAIAVACQHSFIATVLQNMSAMQAPQNTSAALLTASITILLEG